MESFQQFIGNFGNYSWVVLFAQASIDIVSDTYSVILGREVDYDIFVDFTPRKSSEQFSPTGAIVQIEDSAWTIIFHLVGQWSEFNTKGLSKKLKAKVLEFSAEDTSGAVGCVLFAPDEGEMHFLTMDDSEYLEELSEELSEYDEEFDGVSLLPSASTIVESYEDLFFSLGIQTVKVALSSDRNIIASSNERAKIIRVDLVKYSLSG